MTRAAIFHWIGYAAGTLTTLAFLPQVLHVWKTKRAEDLHFGTLAALAAGVLLWAIYGLLTWQMPVIVANGVTLMLVLALLTMKCRYNPRNKSQAAGKRALLRSRHGGKPRREC